MTRQETFTDGECPVCAGGVLVDTNDRLGRNRVINSWLDAVALRLFEEVCLNCGAGFGSDEYPGDPLKPWKADPSAPDRPPTIAEATVWDVKRVKEGGTEQ